MAFLSFIQSDNPCSNKIHHAWKSSPQPVRKLPDAEDVGQEAVSDDRPPHQPCDLLVPLHHQPPEEEGHGVWPGQLAVLLPPSLHHKGDIESKQECNWKALDKTGN